MHPVHPVILVDPNFRSPMKLPHSITSTGGNGGRGSTASCERAFARVIRRRGIAQRVLICAGAIMISGGCATAGEGVPPGAESKSGIHAAAGSASTAPTGPWVFVLTNQDGVEVAVRLDARAEGAGRWSAHSRPGATAEFVGRRRALAGRLLRRMPPHGALINIAEGEARQEGEDVMVGGRFTSSMLGRLTLVGSIADGRLSGELRHDPLGPPVWTVEAVPHPAPGALRDYRSLATAIEAAFRDRIYDPALLDRPEFRSFFRELHRRMARAVDDSDAMAAFYAVRPRLPDSHIELFRSPAMAALPREVLLIRAAEEQIVFLTFPAPGVALLRVSRWSGAAEAVTRAFERIDSAGSHTLVLDVRWNPGGDVTSMAPVAHLFRDSTAVGVFVGRKWYAHRSGPPRPADLHTLRKLADGSALSLVQEVAEHGAVVGIVPPLQPYFGGDVYLLINARSASATEPLAHLLRSTGRATLIGEKTAGAMLSAPPGAVAGDWVLIMPEANYFAADGIRLEGTGVSPHVPVPSNRALNAVALRLAARDPYAAALLDGAGHGDAGRWNDASAAYARAQELGPENIAPLSGLGRAHSELGNWSAAFDAYQAILSRRPNDPAALYHFGRVAAISGERLAEGEAALRTGLTQPPPPGVTNHAVTFWRLGMILEAAGRSAEAREAYRSAAELDPRVTAYTVALRRLGG
jgi:carboxyl-terminal processing protease